MTDLRPVLLIPFDGDDDVATCPECDGTGLVLNFEGTDDEECPTCEGYGVIFTKPAPSLAAALNISPPELEEW
jgi:hypothetical protein